MKIPDVEISNEIGCGVDFIFAPVSSLDVTKYMPLRDFIKLSRCSGTREGQASTQILDEPKKFCR